MEYAHLLTTDPCYKGLLTKTYVDDNSMRFVGWDNTSKSGCMGCYDIIHDPTNLTILSNKITQLLEGVDRKNRPIIVPHETIAHVLSSVYQSQRPEVGDIYSRYIIDCKNDRNDVQQIIDRSIAIIVSQIRNEYGMIENNEKLSIWNALYGDFNPMGLRQHPPIKIRKKRPTPMQFNMNY